MFLVCSNVNGTEFVPLVMIGKVRRLRCFGSADPSELGLEYDYRGKPWMNTAIFFWRSERLDRNIARTPDLTVLMFIYYCTAQESTTNLPDLRHVRVVFLPKNRTSILQPLDLGVIACIKKRLMV